MCGLVLLAAILAPAPSAPAPQIDTAGRTFCEPCRYLDLVARYRHESERRKVVEELMRWSFESVDQGVGTLAPMPPVLHQAATLLEGDVARLAYQRGDANQGEHHLLAALRILTPLAPSINRDPDHWARRWLLAMSLTFVSRGDAERSAAADAIAFLKKALRLLGRDDPQLLLTLGQIEEYLGTRQFRGWAPEGARNELAWDPREALRELSENRAYVRDAEDHFRHALAADPELHEARLHLGRVQQVQGQDAEARESFEAVLSAQPQDGYLVYVANLLLGGLDESAGDLTDAAACYRAAVDADPSSQVAVLALAHVTHRLGQRRESAEIVERLLSRGEDPLHMDGWWVFRRGPFADEYRVEEILDELRAEITE